MKNGYKVVFLFIFFKDYPSYCLKLLVNHVSKVRHNISPVSNQLRGILSYMRGCLLSLRADLLTILPKNIG